MSEPTYLTLRIILTTGEITTYEQRSTAEIATVMAALAAPHRLYVSPQIYVGSASGLTAFRSERIARIDFISDAFPPLPYLNDAESVRDLGKYMYDQHYEQNYYQNERLVAAEHPGTKQVGFVKIGLAGFGDMYWEVTMKSQQLRPMDVFAETNTLLASHGLLAELDDSCGYMVVNPANITTMSFQPGPPVFPPKSWRLNLIGEVEPG